MHLDSARHKLFNRRTIMLGGGQFVLLSGLIGRMYYLQVIDAERYRTLAEENRINLRLLAPPRGRLFDRFGIPIAENRQNYQVLLISEDTPDIEATLDTINEILPLTPKDRRRIRRDVSRNRKFVPVTVRSNLNWNDVARIEVNAPDLPGIMIDVGQSRYYPYGVDIAHVLGYVGTVSQKELTKDPLLELPDFKIGKAGVEKVHDLELRGIGGNSQVEVNAFGRVIRELSRQEGLPGSEISLTIDMELQRMVNRRMGEESSAVVVMDAHSGEVLSMTSTPAYDPNAFNRGLSVDEWQALVKNPKYPLSNKAISGQYSPGSTFKMVVLMAALEKGVINPNSKIFCTGVTKLGNSEFHCWKKHGHGNLDAKGAITQSCDIYFYEIARRTGIDRIAAMANRFGLGQSNGFELPGERSGHIPTRKWKRKAMNAGWHEGETLISGIGQGYVLTTPLQLAVMTARMVNGGIAITPKITRRVAGSDDQPNPAPPPNLNIPAAHLSLVRQAMADVVNSAYGTAYSKRIMEPEFAMGGKTGTVQVRRITKAEREAGVKKNKDLPWKQRDHAIFVGFAPISAPKYVISVVVEHGGSGSSVAAPIARDILLEAQKRGSANMTKPHLVTSELTSDDSEEPSL